MGHGCKVLIRIQREPFVFDLPPEKFDEVKFRAVGRDELQIQIPLLPAFNLLLEVFARVDGGIINDD